MSRPLRIDDPGMWHHVMNRGLNRRNIFVCDTDRRRFLRLLRESVHRFQLIVHAYCLMDNHYHLLVEDPLGQLSRAMRHINGLYTQGFNRSHHRDGPLFRGRFRAQVVERESYGLELLRYIHLNPVKAHMVTRANDYLWSSYRYYLAERQPPWLCISKMLDQFGGHASRRIRLDEFTHERADFRPEIAAHPCVLGSDTFADECKTRARSRPARMKREVAYVQRFVRPPLTQVIERVADALGFSPSSLTLSCRGIQNDNRLVAIWCCRDAGFGNAEIGAAFGVAPRTVSTLAVRGRDNVRRNEGLATALKNISWDFRPVDL